MDHKYWHQKWTQNEIGFHQSAPNPLLTAHFGALALPENARIFVPLCGKTPDIGWLMSKGFRILGVELSEIAVKDLFEDLGLTPEIVEKGGLKLYAHDQISIYAGDIFALNAGLLGVVDAIYDRAALVALPEKMRSQYVEHLMKITGAAPQLLICFEYDQSHMTGPPFSISDAMVKDYYEGQYTLEALARVAIEGNLKGRVDATENVWHLKTL